MPKLPHEALVQLVRAAPEMVVRLLREALGVDLPPQAPPRITAAEFVNLDLPEHRADAVVLLGEPAVEGLVLEVQNTRRPRKRRIWALYTAAAQVRFDCPVTLVVLALDRRVAAWASAPIAIGRQGSLRPVVIGPAQIPVITDPARAARAPELAVLSVAAHGHEPGAEHIALAALEGVADLDRERRTHYADFVAAFLGEVAEAALEQLMAAKKDTIPWFSERARKAFVEGRSEGRSEGRAEGKAEGRIAGKAQLLLRMLRLRGWEVPEAVQARVLGCTDEAEIDGWADRVLSAADLGGVFG